MQEKEALARRYCREVRRKIPVGGKEKRLFMRTLHQRVEEFLNETEHTDFAAFEKAFGSPETIALSFWGEMSYPKIAKKIRFRNWVIAIVASLAILVLVSHQIAIHKMIEENRNQANGTIVYSGPRYMTEEEFERFMEEVEAEP